ncbi:helix-turn-helix domain-containing protein [Streptomyces sp. NPDC058321]|uniref:helix-turn-helix domain-containing protein n=1 Tax=Streptomyces sp. NPDC058321 TaxID=3346445 RepID=UPI0036F002DF
MNTDRSSRTFDVLEALAGQPEGMSLTEISQAVGAPVSSTHNQRTRSRQRSTTPRCARD